MSTDPVAKVPTFIDSKSRRPLCPQAAVAELKAKQSSKIRELGTALAGAGIRSLDEQARVLSLPRSTTWTILRGNHKSSGLSTAVINRMLASPELPASVRTTILEYVEEKIAGSYGDSRGRLREFDSRLSELKLSDTTGRQSIRARASSSNLAAGMATGVRITANAQTPSSPLCPATRQIYR